MSYTIPDFGPSDLLTSDRFEVRRIKTSSEPSIGGATEVGLAYTVSGSVVVNGWLVKAEPAAYEVA